MIEMIAGVFGLPVDGTIKAMDNNSGPFEAGAEQEARLVELGLAKYVHNSVKDPTDLSDESEGLADFIAPIGFDDLPEDVETDEVEEVDLASLSAKELREVGLEYDLIFKGNASKAEMIRLIKDAQAAEASEIAEDGEHAPEFDAAEAVV